MKIELSLKTVIATVLIVLAFIGLAFWITEVQRDLKYSQNFTAIVNQLNQNTAALNQITQALQANGKTLPAAPQVKK